MDFEADSEQRYRQLVKGLPAAVYTCDANGIILLYNDAAVELWGRKPVLGKDLWCGSWKLYRHDGTPLPMDQCPMAIAISEGRRVWGEEIIIERPDGKRRYVLPHAQPIVDVMGNVVEAVNMLVDITDFRTAEKARLEAEIRMQQLQKELNELKR